MKLFEKDTRILVLDDVAHISLYHDFQGALLCPYDPFTKSEQDNIEAFARRMIEGRDMFDADDSIDPLYPETWKEIIEEYPSALDGLKDTLRKAYKDVSGDEATTASLRINSTHPSWKHAHSAWAMVYPVYGSGSIGFDQSGNPYSLPLRHIFAIPPDFEHAAPAALAQGELRVTIALSRPEL